MWLNIVLIIVMNRELFVNPRRARKTGKITGRHFAKEGKDDILIY